MKRAQKSTKENHLTQTTQVAKIQPIRHVIKFFKHLIIPVIIAACLFSFEFAENYSKDYVSAVADYRATKKKLDKATADLIKLAPPGEKQQIYTAAKASFDNAAASFFRIKKEEKFLGFKSFQLFLGEFGKWLGVFIFSIVFLFYHLRVNPKNKQITFIIVTVVGACFYYLNWVLSVYQTNSKPQIYLMCFGVALLVYLAAYFGSKYIDPRIEALKRKNKRLALFVFKNIKPEKRDEMLEVLNDTTESA